ncbi:MAG: translation elongation factor Ts [bacterium]|jgi:elongation factor Ts|nr:translation elongation factor Ts [bacterium]MDD3804632.1 translation elongation factor Ts [bacterium]MDD4153268.1 translation elongation factor Ts [bacterium]MDD4557381.1 translation elongation factor Ts [bacterium]
MDISAAKVKELREKTGAGMMDCKKALTEANGDMGKAADILRTKGLASVAKRTSRVAAEGVIEAYIHGGGKLGVLVEVNCETDFVAKTDEFKAFARDIAMQIAATDPDYVGRDDVPADILDREKSVLKEQALQEGKPANIVDKIIEGRLDKFYSRVCLLDQPFVKDDSQTVGDVLKETIAKLGENMVIRRFVRYVLGQGVQE